MRGKSFKETAGPQVENPGQGAMQPIVDAGLNVDHGELLKQCLENSLHW